MGVVAEKVEARARVVAMRGTERRCRGWKQETILRLLENNLENGERPEDLVVYMSAARAARDWASFDRIVAVLKDLRDDETLVVQSGKPVARFRTHTRAPRVIMANGVVVGRWTDDKTVFELERAGLTITPGMTAAAWQYIGSQGVVQGTYQSFTGAAERFGGTLAGRSILTAGCGGMGGAQPLAGKMAGAATLVVEVNPEHCSVASPPATSTMPPPRSTRRSLGWTRCRRRARADPSALRGTSRTSMKRSSRAAGSPMWSPIR